MLSSCGSKPEVGPPLRRESRKAPRADLMEVPEVLRTPAAKTVSQGWVDIVNEVGPVQTTDKENIFHAKSDSPLWIRGWAYDDAAKKTPNRVWIELTGKASGSRFFLPADRMERPDVATGFRLPWAGRSGFATQIVTDHNITRGAYDLKIYQIDGQTVELTMFYSVGAVTLIFE